MRLLSQGRINAILTDRVHNSMVTLYFKYTGPDLTSTLMLRCCWGIIFTNMQTTIVYWFVDTSCKCTYLFQELYYC